MYIKSNSSVALSPDSLAVDSRAVRREIKNSVSVAPLVLDHTRLARIKPNREPLRRHLTALCANERKS